MIKEVLPVIEWISHCIDVEKKSQHSSVSLWSELYEFGNIGDQADQNLPKLPKQAAPMVVFVTGTLEEIRMFKGPFYLINEPEDLVFLTYGEENQAHKSGHIWSMSESLLRFLTICYVPRRLVPFYQDQISRFIVLTKGKPEIWMRSLLNKKKVAGLIGWEHSVDDAWDVSWSVSYEDLSYDLFLKDELTVQKQMKQAGPILPYIPAGLKLGLMRALRDENSGRKEELWRKTMDQSAMQLLDEYWLLNGLTVKEFMPKLVEKVYQYCLQIRSIPPKEKNVKRVENSFVQWMKKEVI